MKNFVRISRLYGTELPSIEIENDPLFSDTLFFFLHSFNEGLKYSI